MAIQKRQRPWCTVSPGFPSTRTYSTLLQDSRYFLVAPGQSSLSSPRLGILIGVRATLSWLCISVLDHSPPSVETQQTHSPIWITVSSTASSSLPPIGSSGTLAPDGVSGGRLAQKEHEQEWRVDLYPQPQPPQKHSPRHSWSGKRKSGQVFCCAF